ncbi:MAG: hypothetical protein EXS63_03150 [Candidatus Omnitrophica bacterium]|nr:hypothetical protein [Candidatus Omnitrophota bacterium]
MSESQKTKKYAMLAASIAGIMAVCGTVSLAYADDMAMDSKDGVSCYGVNACKGQGACGGKGHGCAGENSCKGKGWIKAENKEACLKMEGGSLKPTAITD